MPLGRGPFLSGVKLDGTQTTDYHHRQMERTPATSHHSDRNAPGDAGLSDLESSLGYRFKNRDLLLTALRHGSYAHQYKNGDQAKQSQEDNQRLEFLGDAVLGLCISTLLYHRFTDVREGTLHRMRAGLVNESRLYIMAMSIGLDRAIFLGKGEETAGGRQKSSILADAMEALVAAVYLDGGFEAVTARVESLWGDLIAQSSDRDLLKDYKTRLQELTQQKMGRIPEYLLTDTQGPDHDRTFLVTLALEGRPISTGAGRSKKEAEQTAARIAFEKISAEPDEP